MFVKTNFSTDSQTNNTEEEFELVALEIEMLYPIEEEELIGLEIEVLSSEEEWKSKLKIRSVKQNSLFVPYIMIDEFILLE